MLYAFLIWREIDWKLSKSWKWVDKIIKKKNSTPYKNIPIQFNACCLSIQYLLLWFIIDICVWILDWVFFCYWNSLPFIWNHKKTKADSLDFNSKHARKLFAPDLAYITRIYANFANKSSDYVAIILTASGSWSGFCALLFNPRLFDWHDPDYYCIFNCTVVCLVRISLKYGWTTWNQNRYCLVALFMQNVRIHSILVCENKFRAGG